MLKRPITYTDFNDVEHTEDFYFNISKFEIIELQVSVDEGLQEMLTRIIKTENKRELVAEFKKLILLTYGEKSEDGQRFVKTDDVRDKFASSAAFDALLFDLTTNEAAAAAFVNGVIPKDLAQQVAAQNKTAAPPLPPTKQ